MTTIIMKKEKENKNTTTTYRMNGNVLAALECPYNTYKIIGIFDTEEEAKEALEYYVTPKAEN